MSKANDPNEKLDTLALRERLSILESYKTAMDASSIVSTADLQGNITYANEKLAHISGYSIEELLGKSHRILKHPDTPKELFQELWRTIQSKKVWKGIVQNRGKHKDYWIDATIVPILDKNQNIKEYISIRHDITQMIEYQKTIKKMIKYQRTIKQLITMDTLTGLANRMKLHEDLKESKNPSLVLINIDGFSQINDFYGHGVGDVLLVAFGKLLQQELHAHFKDSFEAYRYSGDEFALLIESQSRGSLLKKIFQIVHKIKTNLVLIEGIEINLTLSCGISFEPIPYLLSSADMALKTSKKEKKDFVVYTLENDLNQKYENNLLWAKRVKNAIKENRLEPFFQEIVNNANLVEKKYEALVRIVERDGTIITPYHFLEIAKQTKQYLQLTQIMIEKSFEVFRHRENEFSINLTMEDIISDEMREFLYEKLHDNPKIAKRVVLELVETESLQDYNPVIDFINIVKSHGCKIAIDDFGSGYSNFEYLVKLQADFIKIDGSLIRHINTQKESYVVVSTIVSFAKQMGIKTIAEFIENEDIFQTVKELGIDYSQGYYFSPPRSKTEI